MEGARSDADAPRRGTRAAPRKVAEPAADYEVLTPVPLAAKLRELEARMYQHARDLEFEEAARLRDRIHALREQELRS